MLLRGARGGMRHLDVQLRWLQECVQQGRLLVIKVSGATNVADAMTKYHDVLALKTLLVPHGIEVAPAAGGGRADGGVGRSAPKRAQITSCTVPLLCIGGVACCGFAVPQYHSPSGVWRKHCCGVASRVEKGGYNTRPHQHNLGWVRSSLCGYWPKFGRLNRNRGGFGRNGGGPNSGLGQAQIGIGSANSKAEVTDFEGGLSEIHRLVWHPRGPSNSGDHCTLGRSTRITVPLQGFETTPEISKMAECRVSPNSEDLNFRRPPSIPEKPNMSELGTARKQPRPQLLRLWLRPSGELSSNLRQASAQGLRI